MSEPARHGVGASPLFWIALVALAFTVPAVMLLRRPEPPPVFGSLPAFALTDQDGKGFSLASLRGRPFIANFIFTSCPTVCPLLTSKMASLQERTKGLGDRAHLVSFSVDPWTDTPEVLKAYGQRFGQDPSRWTFVTGPYAELERTVISGFKVAMSREARDAGEGYDVVHGEHFVLVDGGGRIRGYYRAEPVEMDRLVKDLGVLVEEGQ